MKLVHLENLTKKKFFLSKINKKYYLSFIHKILRQ